MVFGLHKPPRIMKPLAIFLIVAILYGFAALRVKSLLEGASRLGICKSELMRHGCDFLGEYGTVP